MLHSLIDCSFHICLRNKNLFIFCREILNKFKALLFAKIWYPIFFLTLQNPFCWTSRPLCRRRKIFWFWNITSVGYPSKFIILSYGLTHSYSSTKTREDIWGMNDVLSSHTETKCKFLEYYSNLNYLYIKYYSGKSWLNLDEFS